MKKNSLILLLISSIFFINCDKKESTFPIDKKYWTVEDYKDVIGELQFGENREENLPTLDNPENKIIIEKLIDQENFKVVLDDEELGIKHKNEVGKGFFDVWNNMNQIYSARDKTDKFVYENEMIEIFNFGLSLQLKYFKLGNDEIKENSDDPNSSNVQNITRSNVDTLVKNYLFYLDEINDEKSYSDNGISKIADGIDTYFIELVNQNPNADYQDMIDKISLLEKKSKSEKLRNSLKNLLELINTKKRSENNTETI